MSEFVERFFCTKLSLNFIIETYRNEASMNKLDIENYTDVTKEWLENATPNNHIVKE